MDETQFLQAVNLECAIALCITSKASHPWCTGCDVTPKQCHSIAQHVPFNPDKCVGQCYSDTSVCEVL